MFTKEKRKKEEEKEERKKEKRKKKSNFYCKQKRIDLTSAARLLIIDWTSSFKKGLQSLV